MEFRDILLQSSGSQPGDLDIIQKQWEELQFARKHGGSGSTYYLNHKDRILLYYRIRNAQKTSSEYAEAISAWAKGMGHVSFEAYWAYNSKRSRYVTKMRKHVMKMWDEGELFQGEYDGIMGKLVRMEELLRAEEASLGEVVPQRPRGRPRKS